MEKIIKDKILTSAVVAVSAGNEGYPSVPPYSPDTFYPEYPFSSDTLSSEINHAYDGVRNVLKSLALDKEHFGQKQWNPLGEFVNPGNTVVLKPNFVRNFRETFEGHANCLITNGAIIRAVIDYVYIALKGKGRIIIADAPQNDADFDEIRKIAGLDEIQSIYNQHVDFDVDVYDLRPECANKIDGVIVSHDKLSGDPSGYVKVNLDSNSMFAEVEDLCHLLYGSEYDTREICSHHTGGVHEYLISKTILEADCVINLPKLKTHKKTGLTVCMKNLVGINGNKNWLPHHRSGTPSQGGDQFADNGMKHRFEQKAMACFRKAFPKLGLFKKAIARPAKAFGTFVFGNTNTDTIRSGNWYGNDTTWRMVIDLNRILMYTDSHGKLQNKPARRMFCIVDGIVGGEGNGPLDPTAKPTGIILAGTNPIVVDLVCARLMGFDYERLPLLCQSLSKHSLPLCSISYDDVICISKDSQFNKSILKLNEKNMAFKPHFGWNEHIEINCSEGSKTK